ncbi:hypothetical protein [Streptomyces caatingaensis]|uniref:Membrane protein n=1 Tax=Streptomyces caatingaensis TaxID=1678637 RepID=A0A0K9XF23_9ACTN|nr:hypothetical protein [Streptomyces caatingaensis]KNB52034.1 membrane protein [Streptomyces caatingaensis]
MSGQHPRTPQPIRFFGTTWVEHDGGYALRRAGVAVGGLLAAVAGALLLRLGYEGLAIAKVGGVVNVLVAGAVAICTALAFRRTWEGFVRRPDPAREGAEAAERPSSGLLAIGFVGVFLAWSLRALQEAPGERLHRREYEEGGGREHP